MPEATHAHRSSRQTPQEHSNTTPRVQDQVEEDGVARGGHSLAVGVGAMGNNIGGKRKGNKVMQLDGMSFLVKPLVAAADVLRNHPGF